MRTLAAIAVLPLIIAVTHVTFEEPDEIFVPSGNESDLLDSIEQSTNSIIQKLENIYWTKCLGSMYGCGSFLGRCHDQGFLPSEKDNHCTEYEQICAQIARKCITLNPDMTLTNSVEFGD